MQRKHAYSSENLEKPPQLRRFCSQTGLEKVSQFTQQASFVPYSLNSTLLVRFRRFSQAKKMRLQIDGVAKDG
jgi:hypothetical protein